MFTEGLITHLDPFILFRPSKNNPISLIFENAPVNLLRSGSCKVFEAINTSILSVGEDFCPKLTL